MRLLFSFLLIGLLSVSAKAQLNVQSKFFVYFQTEPVKEFYIKISNQTIKANSSGYLILPQINNGTYKLVVGFPDKSASEQIFAFIVDGKDKGYLIKNFGVDGWGLFDLQTMSIIKTITEEQANALNKPQMPVKKEEPKKVEVKIEEPKKETAIAKQDTVAVKKEDAKIVEKMEAPIVEAAKKLDSIPAVKIEPAIKKAEIIIAEKKAEIATPIKKVETVYDSTASDFTKLLSKAANNPELLEKPIVVEPKKEVIKVVENTVGKNIGTVLNKDATGVVAEFTDPDNKDQKIKIFIPQSKSAVQPEKQIEKVEQKVAEKKEAVKEKVSEVKEEPKAVVVSFSGLKKLKFSAGNCKQTATDADFLVLRKAMSEQLADADMIKVAAAPMKEKCFTTSQVKYLSAMFLSEVQKLNFFKANVQNVSDPQNYYSLIAELESDTQKAAFEQLFEQ